jgi:hypothetical protein
MFQDVLLNKHFDSKYDTRRQRDHCCQIPLSYKLVLLATVRASTCQCTVITL